LTSRRVELPSVMRERIVRSFLDVIILKLLQKGPKWGYELIAEIHDKYGVSLSAGTTYPLLYSLEERGLVEGTWETQKKRGRRVYKITQKGGALLEAGEIALREILGE